MPDARKGVPLDYRSSSPQALVKDAEYWRWWRYRMSFRGGLAGLFCIIAFYFGPHVINFGTLGPLTPAYFTADVQQRCVPIVRAILAYQRDKGSLPPNLDALVPAYLPAAPGGAYIETGQLVVYSKWEHEISYNLGAGPQIWQIHGPFVSGVIPALPVPPAPATQPAGAAH